MKVVLFCGGLGMRMRDYSDDIPKPMVNVGNRPILWNLMKYYSHFGHKDFILCLGYKAELIKRYFLEYREAISNDFVFSRGGSNVQLLSTDIQDWNITFIDSGLTSNVGQRFLAASGYLKGEDVFLVNYTDVLTDMHLPDMIRYANKKDKIACLLSVKTSQRFHVVDSTANGLVKGVKNIGQSDLRINGGFYVFKKEILDYIKDGEDLVEEPFQRLIKIKEIAAFIYDGFWVAMDTFRDKQFLEDKYTRGETPWEVWKKP